MHEALPVFLALALLNMIVGTGRRLALTGATRIPVARVLYVPRLFRWVFPWCARSLGGKLGRPGDDAAAAAEPDLTAEMKSPRPVAGPGARHPASGIPAFCCSSSSLRSSFICLVSIGRISLMKHCRGRRSPSRTCPRCSRCGDTDGIREHQVRAVAGHRDEIGFVDARPDHQLVLGHRAPATSKLSM